MQNLNIDKEDKRELCNLFRFEICQGMDYAINIGSEGDKFYVIV